MALELRPNCECCDRDLPPSFAGAHLFIRVHLLRRLRRDDAAERLPELRGRICPAADSAGDGMAARAFRRKAPAIIEACVSFLRPRRDKGPFESHQGHRAGAALALLCATKSSTRKHVI